MRIKSLLGLFAAGVLVLPLSLFLFARLIFGLGSASESSLPRGIAAFQVLMEAVKEGSDGKLTAKEGARVPPWMDLVVLDVSGAVVFSSFPGIPAGGAPAPGTLEAMLSPKAGYRVMSESFAYGGEVVGAYAMRYKTQVTSLSSDPAAPFMFIFFLLGLAALIALLTGIVSTGIARSFGKLEKAAERIASGDIESAIPQGRRGLREMSALAAAMERMRGALQDERSRRARFLASVSHDLRTPLTSIKGYIEAVEDGMAADGETLERYTRIMKEKAAILEDRVNELLDFARMGTGEWRLRRVELPLRRYLQGLCAAYREDAMAAGRSFDFALEDLGERAVLADPKMLSRALENVFSNALRYSPAGGAVGLKASVSGERIELVFSDSGPGIPKDELERIFEPYFRGKSAAAEGEGLGLAISRSILHDHGWLIRASSPPEGGARFTVTIVPAAAR